MATERNESEVFVDHLKFSSLLCNLTVPSRTESVYHNASCLEHFPQHPYEAQWGMSMPLSSQDSLEHDDS